MVTNSETITLYHGSTKERLNRVLANHEDLFGYVSHRFPELSGTLTGSMAAATEHARNLTRVNLESPIVLVFSFPPEIVRLLGPFITFEKYYANIYITTVLAQLSELPPEYLEHGLSSSPSAELTENEAMLEFHRISCQYLKQIIQLSK